MARPDCPMISGAKGNLEVVLEGGGLTGASGEGRVEMSQITGIGEAISFSGRIAQKTKSCPHHVRGSMPFAQPAVGTCQGHGES